MFLSLFLFSNYSSPPWKCLVIYESSNYMEPETFEALSLTRLNLSWNVHLQRLGRAIYEVISTIHIMGQFKRSRTAPCYWICISRLFYSFCIIFHWSTPCASWLCKLQSGGLFSSCEGIDFEIFFQNCSKFPSLLLICMPAVQ